MAKYVLTKFGQQLVLENLHLVNEATNKYKTIFYYKMKRTITNDELYSGGCIGLIHAVAHYNPKSEMCHWQYYAKNCIFKTMLSIASEYKFIRIPLYLKKPSNKDHRFQPKISVNSLTEVNIEGLTKNSEILKFEDFEEFEENKIKLKKLFKNFNNKIESMFLMKFDGLKNREIAEKLSVSESYIQFTIAKNLKKMKQNAKC